MFVVKRSNHNPVLIPDRNRYWEAFATFNLSPVKKGNMMYGFYRAISLPDKLRHPEQMSVVGRAESKDGTHFENRIPFIEPVEEWEKFGCEDPRATFFEGKYYIFYTALSVYPFAAPGIKVAVAISKDLKKVDERHLVVPFNSKAMTLFPERINGKVTVIFTAHTDEPPAKICIAQADSIEEFFSKEFWDTWHAQIDSHVIDLKRNPYDHVEVGATPILTDRGWLLVYSHTQNYFQTPEHYKRAFGIEALLLDVNNPQKIIGRTLGPVLSPEEPYELSGYVADVVFPSGAYVEGDELSIYYGAADTTVCRAKVSLTDLISTISPETSTRWHLKRFSGNPTLVPISGHPWEAQAVFNPAALKIGDTTHILYRALSTDNTSTVGYATTKDGITIDERLSEPIYLPREGFEMKKIENANSGCEDPRLTKIGKHIYMCYTAFDGIGPPRVAVTSISESDFLKRSFKWAVPQLITPRDVDDKDACILDEKIKGKYLIMHRVGTDICGDYLDSLNFEKDTVTKCIKILGPRINTWDSAKVGITAPPVKTKKGWLLLYHAVSKNHHTYRVGAALLDLKDPTIVIARSADPIFEPEEKYEKEGIVNNVVFPCGMTVSDDLLYVYYGGADKVVGVATMELDIVVSALERGASLK